MAGDKCPVCGAECGAENMPGHLRHHHPDSPERRSMMGYPQARTIRDVLGPSFPRIVCLLGPDSGEAAEREALEGRLVLARTRHLAMPTHDTEERLDDLLLRMIDLADEIVLLNRGCAVGFKTGNALAYALAWKKPVRPLEPLDLEAWLAARDREMKATAMKNVESTAETQRAQRKPEE